MELLEAVVAATTTSGAPKLVVLEADEADGDEDEGQEDPTEEAPTVELAAVVRRSGSWSSCSGC